jgi:hypothetical protein
MAATNAAGKLLPLHDLRNVNTVLAMLYDENGVYRAAFKPEVFYNTILLDTLRYGDENYVHLKYAETLTIRKGESTAKFMRWAGMTPTLTPLREGVPPAPDKHAYETIEVGNIFSFGRWSEYTDRIDLSVVSDVIARRSHQYGEVANQTKELYARKTWLSAPNEFYANFKAGFADLQFGDEITLDDLRFLVARMKRMMVKPIGGKFNYICSTEFINGLIDDPRVVQYMKIEQTTGKLWGSGEPFDMFELSLIPTMLDEFAYPDTEFPGVYETASGKEVIRLYAVSDNTIYYLDVHQDYEVKTNVTAKKTASTVQYLKDGTAVEAMVTWELPTDAATLVEYEAADPETTGSTATPGIVGTGEATDEKIVARMSTISKDSEGKTTYSPMSTVLVSNATEKAAHISAINTLIDTGSFMQLPVHRGILFGDEAMLKLSVEGISDQPKIIIKALGSAGVLDPLDQRQSVGFKVDGFGLAIKRPEAICITYSIPKNAEFAALTSKFISGDYILMDGQKEDDSYANYIGSDGAGALRVDGVNLGGYPGDPNVQGFTDFTPFSASKDYAKGDKVVYNGKYYVFKVAHTAGAWNAAHVKRANTLEENVLDVANDPTSNVK